LNTHWSWNRNRERLVEEQKGMKGSERGVGTMNVRWDISFKP